MKYWIQTGGINDIHPYGLFIFTSDYRCEHIYEKGVLWMALSDLVL